MSPTSISKDELLRFLRSVVDAVEDGRSWEGSLQYAVNHEGNYEVQAAIRQGPGNGSVVLVGEDDEYE